MQLHLNTYQQANKCTRKFTENHKSLPTTPDCCIKMRRLNNHKYLVHYSEQLTA